jgi:hypothetical protein
MVALITLIIFVPPLLLPMYFGNINLIPPAIAQSSKEDVNSLYSKALEAIEQDMYEDAIV